MKTAKDYYIQFVQNNFEGVKPDGFAHSSRTTESTSRYFFEDETGRYIIFFTSYYDLPEVEIFPNYRYYENNNMGDNNGSKIDRFDPSELDIIGNEELCAALAANN